MENSYNDFCSINLRLVYCYHGFLVEPPPTSRLIIDEPYD